MHPTIAAAPPTLLELQHCHHATAEQVTGEDVQTQHVVSRPDPSTTRSAAMIPSHHCRLNRLDSQDD